MIALQSAGAPRCAASSRALHDESCRPPRVNTTTLGRILRPACQPVRRRALLLARRAPRGSVPEGMVLRLHLEALAVLPSRLAPACPGASRSEAAADAPAERRLLGYRARGGEAAVPDLEVLPNNSLGSYDVPACLRRPRGRPAGRFCEDDYVPAPAHYDTLLVRMPRRVRGGGDGSAPVPRWRLQGRPVEPTSPAHLESSHIMSAATLARLFERAAPSRRSMTRACRAHRVALRAKL